MMHEVEVVGNDARDVNRGDDWVREISSVGKTTPQPAIALRGGV